MGRPLLLFVIGLFLSGLALCRTAAQPLRSGVRVPPAPVRRFPQPLVRAGLGNVPTQRISKEEAALWKRQHELAAAGVPGARMPAPPPVNQQFLDLTTNPRPPLIGPSTESLEIQPFWSWDQQFIYFSSNNIDPIGNYGATQPPGSARFHIYRMTSDGAFITQITGTSVAGEANGNQFFPALNHALTKLAYVHRDSPADPFQLYVLDFFTGRREQLTGISVLNNPLNSQIVNVERPAWSPTDNVIVFAARNGNVTGDVRNIYVVDVISRVVTKLTNGTPANRVECIDPVYHPSLSASRVAFAANTSGVSLATGDLTYTANPLRDLRGDGIPDDIDHNIFTIPAAGPTPAQPAQQLTTAFADDIEPSYNQSVYPPGQGTGAFNNYLAFASLGRRPDPATPIGVTYDIYFNSGVSETLEPPIRLFTPDTNAGAIPLNQTDERYPTWSAGLPPQNPIDRIAFSSNRQTVVDNVNNTSTVVVGDPFLDSDIWAAEVTDITPPTLLSFDETLGETLHIANAPLPNVGRRVGVAGERFYFYARVKDGQYGVESVWAQIKDPDGPSTDSIGQNRKLYGVGTFPGPASLFNNVFPVRFVNGAPTHFLHHAYETDYQGIGVNDYQYYSGQVRPDIAAVTNAQFASKNPGVDDSVRWSGNQPSFFDPVFTSNRPPLDASGNDRWLRLHDDGVFPDLVAGDDVFSADWITPSEPSDFYVDIIAYDKAFNPRAPSEQQNWIIYDNIWGFSTQPFASRNQVLFVDDNGAGQKWPRGLKGSFRPFPQFRYGTESDIIDRPDQFMPREVRAGGPGGSNLFDISDPGSGVFAFPVPTNEIWHFLNGNAVPYDFISWARGSLRAYKHDIWRILAKGPLPETVLNDYVPTTEIQPVNVTGSQTRTQPIPRRAVVWNAPYTGDIFLGAGSILDQATQTLLTNYRSRAGRLVVAGGDILWAITSDGLIQNQLFTQNTLGANPFQPGDDETIGNFQPFVGAAVGQDITLDRASRDFNPFGDPPYWGPFYDPDVLGTLTAWPTVGSNNVFSNPGQSSGNVDWTAATDGTPFRTQDRVRVRGSAGWEEIFVERMIAKDDTDPTSPSYERTNSKTVFMSFSLASMGRRYIAMDDTARLDCMNYRAKISHAMFCWMFSADLVGQIRNLNGGAPISGAFVEALQGGRTVGSAFSRADGTYAIRGLPVGGWNVRVTNPGFQAFNKATGSGAHGLTQAQLDVLMTPAAPGSISGRVTDLFNQPVPGVTIRADIQASPLFTGQRVYTAVTGPDGTYVIPSAPTAGYDVMVDQTNLPPLFINPAPLTQVVTVIAAQDTPNVDFTLEGQPGPLTVTVFPQLPDGTADRANPVQGADVTLLDSTNQPLPGQTGVTDAAGRVSFTAVPAGPTTVSVFKRGFQEGTRVVAIPQVSQVEILLAVAPPRDLFGTVLRSIDNQPLGAGDLNPPVSLDLLRRISQLPIGLNANVFSPPVPIPGANPPADHNYQFVNAQEGQFTVALRNHPRFFDAQVDVDVTATLPNVAPVIQLQGRPGVLSGTVREDVGGSAGPPIAGATITVTSTVLNPGNVVATVVSGPDGRWTTDPVSVLTSDVYSVNIAKFGFSTVFLPAVFLAGDTDLGDTLLLRAPRGQVFGLVRRTADQFPRDVEIRFTPLASPTEFATTNSSTTLSPAPDGGQQNYSIGSIDPAAAELPEGDYDVRVTGDPRFQPFGPRRITVPAAGRVRLDIGLVAQPGIVSGVVREQLPDGSAGPPIAGAVVTIRQGATVIAALSTNNAGQYQTATAIAGASYTLTAAVPTGRFIPTTLTFFVEGPTVLPDILLTPVPPSVVTGTVRNRVTNALIAGAIVELLPASGQGPPVATDTSAGTATGSPPANYRLTPAPPNNYIVRARRGGFKSAQVNVTVTPGQDRTGVNLLLDPDHTFGAGLLLISLPDDFPGQDAAALFEQNPATFRSAYFLPDQNRYAVYPEPEAREFRLGKGMFVRFNSPTSFTQAGQPASNTPFLLPVKSGWNMIGGVRRQRIEWLRVRVSTQAGVFSMQQAMDLGIIQNGLFGYVDGYFRSDFLDPFAGYFMRAFQDATLIIPVDNSVGAAGPSSRVRQARLRPAPSLAQAARELDAAGLAPGSAWKEITRPLRNLFIGPPSRQAPALLFGTPDHWPWRRDLG